jgi:hypothetical protein
MQKALSKAVQKSSSANEYNSDFQINQPNRERYFGPPVKRWCKILLFDHKRPYGL